MTLVAVALAGCAQLRSGAEGSPEAGTARSNDGGEAGREADAAQGNDAGAAGRDADAAAADASAGGPTDGGTPADGNGAPADAAGSEAALGEHEAGTGCGTSPNADRRFPQWPLPAVSPPTSEYAIAKDTVLDNTTGLMWERVPPVTNTTLADATTRCASLAAGGYGDWRVPTRIELLSILDYGQKGTLLNPNVFGSIEDPGYTTQLWSSSTDLLANAFGTEFLVDTAHSGTPADDPGAPYPSRCVRAGCASASTNRFSISGDTALDTITGVVWQRGSASAGMNSDDARTYCSTLSLGGQSGWRVPTIRELVSIFDETQLTQPLWDTTTFLVGSGTEVWSSTRAANLNTEAYYTVDFGTTATVLTEYAPSAGENVTDLVRCVR
jgi:hypothetical protein